MSAQMVPVTSTPSTTVTAPAVTARDTSIDLMKGVLVIMMIYTHAIQLLSGRHLAHWIVDHVTCLIAFPGFLFCFGYASYLAYYARDWRSSWPRMLNAAGKTLVAYYLSAFLWKLLVEHARLDGAFFINLFTVRQGPVSYSDFIIAFALVTALGIACYVPIQRLLDRPVLFWVVTGIVTAFAFFPYGRVHNPYVALLTGSTHIQSFPVLPFFPLYLLGAYFARYQVGFRPVYLIVAVACALPLLRFIHPDARDVDNFMMEHALFNRFPPGIFYVVGSFLLLYLLYLLARWLSRTAFATHGLAWLRAAGANVLFFLLISNLAIFLFNGCLDDRQLAWRRLPPYFIELFVTVVVAVTLYLLGIVQKSARAARPTTGPDA